MSGQHLDATTWRLSGLVNNVRRSAHIESSGVVADGVTSGADKQDCLNHFLEQENEVFSFIYHSCFLRKEKKYKDYVIT